MINIISRNYSTNYCVFVVDSVAELDKLPTTNKNGGDHLAYIPFCISGSRAIVTETSERYILTGQNEWVLDKNASWSTSLNFATSEDINSITNIFLS